MDNWDRWTGFGIVCSVAGWHKHRLRDCVVSHEVCHTRSCDGWFLHQVCVNQQLTRVLLIKVGSDLMVGTCSKAFVC